MNLRIVFKFEDCKLQFYEKRRLLSYFNVNPRAPASRWRRLLKLKRKKINSFKIIIGFFFTPPLFLATKVAISFVCYSPKTIKCTQKPKIEKSLQESTNRASAILHIMSTTRSCAYAQFTSWKEKDKTSKKNVLPVKPVTVALALNHVEVPWLFAVMAQPIFEQFSAMTRKSKMIL